jgi:hypothetical protein
MSKTYIYLGRYLYNNSFSLSLSLSLSLSPNHSLTRTKALELEEIKFELKRVVGGVFIGDQRAEDKDELIYTLLPPALHPRCTIERSAYFRRTFDVLFGHKPKSLVCTFPTYDRLYVLHYPTYGRTF